jgi:hypothetical protein
MALGDPLTKTQQRTTFAPTITNAAYVQPYLWITVAAGAVDFTIRIGAPQFELGAFTTSFIPTTAAAVTRAADACSMPVGAWFDQTKGSMQIEYTIEGVSPGYNAPAQFVGASVDTDYIDADEATTVNATATVPTLAGAGIVIAGAGTSNCTFPNPPNPGGVVHSGASAWGIGQYMAGAHDGTLADVGYGPSTSLPVITRLTIAGLMHYQTPFNLWARHMRYWPRMLSPTELRSVTTVAVEAPALDLNFMSPGVLDPRVTLTRAASTATYFDANGRMQLAATNAPRWDYDPASHVLRGLLIEDARTNIAVPSNNWGTAQAPSSSLDGVVFNVGPGLDGTNTAQAYIPGPWNGVHQTFTFIPGASSTTYTFSTYAKNMGCPMFYMELGNTGFGSNAQAAVFDLSSGTVAQQSGNGSGVIQNAGNGWYRCSMNATTLAGSAAPYVPNIRAGHSLGEIGGVWTGNGVDAVWMWGMQVEAGAYATSHIPTTSAAATRAADVCYAAVGSWFNPVAMSVLSEFFLPYSGWGIISGSGDNNFGNAIYLAANSTSSLTGGGTTAVAQSNFIPNAVNKSCWTYDLLSVQLVNNAGPLAISAYASGTQAAALRLSIGCSPWAFDNQANGHMRHISYWPRRLANAQLAAVTR